jgi:glucokinase
VRNQVKDNVGGDKMELKLNEGLMLAGDIGGTKTNLGLFEPGSGRPLMRVVASYPSYSASSLEEIIGEFLTLHPARVSAACFGIAGPVIKGVVKTTNLSWIVSESGLRERFSWDNVKLVNDLAATARSIPALEHSEACDLNPGRPDPQGTVGVVAPGTGLGMALLFFVNGKPHPLASEGGHVEFAPRDLKEIELLKHLFSKMPHVSVERLVSGPGLFTIYSWLKEYHHHTEPKWLLELFSLRDPSQVISEVAIEEREPLCIESLDLFTTILGSTAGNLALTAMTTGGIYLAGGIVPKILSKLRAGGFMKAFRAKGRFEEFLSEVPVRVVLNDKAALLGAACCASDLLAAGGSMLGS